MAPKTPRKVLDAYSRRVRAVGEHQAWVLAWWDYNQDIAEFAELLFDNGHTGIPSTFNHFCCELKDLVDKYA